MAVELKNISTEQRNINSMSIDTASTLEIVEIINNEDKHIATAIEKVLGDVAKAVDLIYSKLSSGGRLIYVGAGTSGRLGVLDAVECAPTYGVSSDIIMALIAGGNGAFVKAVEGAEDDKELARKDLRDISLSYKDVVVGIAASGRTPYVLSCLAYAKEVEAATISLCCSKNDEMISLSDVAIVVLVGAEVVTGSTRMKSGTAQKMVLNMLSTATMIKMGKVYQNLMVDVQPTNEKLVVRAKSIVMEATGVSEHLALMALEEFSNSAKHAIVMLKANVSYQKACELLNNNDDSIAKALENVGL